MLKGLKGRDKDRDRDRPQFRLNLGSMIGGSSSSGENTSTPSLGTLGSPSSLSPGSNSPLTLSPPSSSYLSPPSSYGTPSLLQSPADESTLGSLCVSPTNGISGGAPMESGLSKALQYSGSGSKLKTSYSGEKIFSSHDDAELAWKEKCNQVSELKASEHHLLQQNAELHKRIAFLEVMKDELETRLIMSESANKESATSSTSSMKKTSKRLMSKNTVSFSLNFGTPEILCSISEGLYLCEVDGWVCQVREFPLDKISERDRQKFEKELSIYEELPHHSNVVKYLHHVKEKNTFRIFTSNHTLSLREHLDTLKETPRPEVIQRWVMDIVRGLEFLHKNNIIHRNLSSHSVYSSSTRTHVLTKLAIGNFGLSRKLSKKEVAASVGAGSHMAPEVHSADKKKISIKSDIWSLGMVLFEMLSLQLPYSNVPPVLLPSVVCSGTRPALPDGVANNSEYAALVDLYQECTRQDPEQRPTVERIKMVIMGDQRNLGAGGNRAATLLSLEWLSTFSLNGVADWSGIHEAMLGEAASLPPLVERQKGYAFEEGSTSFKPTVSPEDSRVVRHFAKYLAPREVDIFVNKDTSEPVIVVISKNHIGYEDEVNTTIRDSLLASPRAPTREKEAPGAPKAFFVMISTAKTDERSIVQTVSKTPSAKEKLITSLVNRPVLSSMRFLHVENPRPFVEDLINFEKKERPARIKIGILYAKPGQTEDEMYNNEVVSKEYEEFLDFLGDRVVLFNFPRFNGGLDTGAGHNDGDFSYFTMFGDYEIMFHVATLIKYIPGDPQQVQRKKHLGNDVVILIFKDSDDSTPFKPSTFVSQFNHVFVIVQPIAGSSPTRYRVALAAKDGVIMHPPYIPNPPIFNKDDYFRSWLLTKLVNAERAAMRAQVFAQKFQRVRTEILKDMCIRHTAIGGSRTPRGRSNTVSGDTGSIIITSPPVIKGGWNRLQPDQEQTQQLVEILQRSNQ